MIFAVINCIKVYPLLIEYSDWKLPFIASSPIKHCDLNVCFFIVSLVYPRVITVSQTHLAAGFLHARPGRQDAALIMELQQLWDHQGQFIWDPAKLWDNLWTPIVGRDGQYIQYIWLMVYLPLWKIFVSWDYYILKIYGKMKNVPNHQTDMASIPKKETLAEKGGKVMVRRFNL